MKINFNNINYRDLLFGASITIKVLTHQLTREAVSIFSHDNEEERNIAFLFLEYIENQESTNVEFLEQRKRDNYISIIEKEVANRAERIFCNNKVLKDSLDAIHKISIPLS